jgi:hypothetical protein
MGSTLEKAAVQAMNKVKMKKKLTRDNFIGNNLIIKVYPKNIYPIETGNP